MRKISVLMACFILIVYNTAIINAQNIFPNIEEVNLSEKIMDRDTDGFIVIAHRGASAYFPENTMSAFRAAVEMEADMIELDVLLTKDMVPVVFHDARLDKKTNGSGLVSEYTLEELRKLDAGSWFDEKFKGEKIPTLEEVLIYTKGKIAVNIEIKPEAVFDKIEDGVEQKVIELVRKHEMTDHVIISSFDYRVIERFKKLAPEFTAALLYERKQSHGRAPVELVQHYNSDAFNFSSSQLADSWATQLNENEIPFFIYTVNDPKLMRSIIRAGAKGIFTDKPDVLKKVAKEVIIKNWQ